MLVLCLGILTVIMLGLWERVSYAKAQRAVARAKALCAELPSGSTRAEVDVYLQRRGIEHSFPKNPSSGLGNYELAIVRDVCGKRIVGCDVTLSFSFDGRDLLTSCSAREIYTGP